MPNILMISVDDLNDWTSVLKGYPGIIHTPNFDRLAARSVSFSNAFTPLPVCNGSRSATLTGMSPLSTGVFENDQVMFDSVAPEFTLTGVLHAAGFETAIAGKVFHDLPPAAAEAMIDHLLVARDSDEYHEDVDYSQIIPTGTTWGTTNDPRNTSGGIYVGDSDLLGDNVVAERVEAFLQDYAPRPDGEGLFLAAGIKRPHSPFIAPPEFFDLYPIDDILLPDVPADELLDLPGFADLIGKDGPFETIRAAGDWRALVQAYLAAISYADHILGRLLDALDASAIADDTMVVLWSDNGFHLGEKFRVGKGTLWEESTRISLMISDPGAPADAAGRIEDQVVSLLDVMPTVLEYMGTAPASWAEGSSLMDLVRTGDSSGLSGVAYSVQSGRYLVRTADYSYIRYDDGSIELYDIRADPGQHVNLADQPGIAAAQAAMAALLDEHLIEHHIVQHNGEDPRHLAAPEAGRVYSGFGADSIAGGAGDNVYVVRGDGIVIEEAADGGRDSVQVVGGFTLPENVEDLTRSLFYSHQSDRALATLTGNVLDNAISSKRARNVIDGLGGDDTLAGAPDGQDTLIGGEGQDRLSGDSGDDSLNGGTGNDSIHGDQSNDSLVGAEGDDSLDGGNGADTMTGGAGDDIYVVASRPDSVVELPGEGQDTILADISIKLTEFPGVEAVMLQGTRNLDATGDAADNLLVGNAGANALGGGAGNDSMVGGAGDDALDGASGNDTLDGGAGADLLQGGKGDDLYLIDALDRLIDSGGRDTVIAAFTVMLAGAIEELLLDGGDAIDGAGNELGNRMRGNAQANWLNGNLGNDTLIGNDGDDSLNGADGDDQLTGGIGNDMLGGGLGADRMEGGVGNDLYRVNSDADQVIERDGELGGVDLVEAKLSYTLPKHVEHLVLSTGGGFAGTGNTAANAITGNASANLLAGLDGADSLSGSGGADTLLGGLGEDLLEGGGGADVLRFLSADEGGDSVLGYAAAQDQVEVSAAGFGGGLLAGMDLLAAGRYVAGPGAAPTEAWGQFVMDLTTLTLWWDGDGTGAGAAMRVASLAGATAWSGAEITVIA